MECVDTLCEEQRVLICAPIGRDAKLLNRTLQENGIHSEICPSIATLASEQAHGCAVALLTEEALHEDATDLIEALRRQPAWSDLPIIILTTGGAASADETWKVLRDLEPLGNVILLERPLRAMTLVSAVQVALRSRNRQYDARSLYEDLESRVAERTAELERLNNEAEGFSYTIAHDLRSPLRSIVATSMILLEEHRHELSDDAIGELQRQAEAAKRLAQLIDELLKLSKLSREQMRPYTFDFSNLAKEAASEAQKEFPESRCEIQIEEGMQAYGDPLLIRFALLNLIQNACKFSPGGGCIRVGRHGDIFFVSDQGIGFKQEYAERVFRPFERLEGQSKFPGTGIGLANVKRIVERHGGKIWAESEPGKGTKFWLRLPNSIVAPRQRPVGELL